MKYIFRDADGKELANTNTPKTTKEAKSYAKANNIDWSTIDIMESADATKGKTITRTPKAKTAPATAKTRKEWDYFTVGFDGTLSKPMNRKDFDTFIETVPDLSKIRAFTGRELKLSRKTIVH